MENEVCLNRVAMISDESGIYLGHSFRVSQ